MSKKQKTDRRAPLPTRTGKSNPPQAAGDSGPEFQGALPAAEALHTRELIASRHSKAAVELAKDRGSGLIHDANPGGWNLQGLLQALFRIIGDGQDRIGL